jgi:hypothetical protein
LEKKVETFQSAERGHDTKCKKPSKNGQEEAIPNRLGKSILLYGIEMTRERTLNPSAVDG